jgi:CRP-like cAMP-binding protein
VILADGQRSQSLYFVLNGSVAVELCTPRFTVCVQALGPGQVFGWSALLDQHYTLFRVRARERTTALRVADSDLAATCRTDTELGMEILFRALKVVAGRVEATEVSSPRCAACSTIAGIKAVDRPGIGKRPRCELRQRLEAPLKALRPVAQHTFL